MREKILWRWEAVGSATGNFLGMRRKIASSMSWMRFVAPRMQMRWGVVDPGREEDERPSQCVMNLILVSIWHEYWVSGEDDGRLKFMS